MSQKLFFEAKMTPAPENELTGMVWDVTIIGAETPDDIVVIEGVEYLYSKNGRLYELDALRESTPRWEGVKVYDNHLTQQEFESKQGMRSPSNEWLGAIVQPYWDEAKKQLRGVFKVVESRLAEKLKNAWKQGVLGTVGLSIDTSPIVGREVVHEGNRTPIIEGFKKILSVDLVGNPAAGGAFDRLIAAQTTADLEVKETMTKEEIEAVVNQAVDNKLAALNGTIAETVKTTLAEALAADAEDETVQEQEQPATNTEAEKAMQEARLARCELVMERKLGTAKLGEAYEKIVRDSFGGRVFEETELEKMIKTVKEAQAASDPSGRVQEAGAQRIETGLSPEDKFGAELQRIIMGNEMFRSMEGHTDETVKERLQEADAYQAWRKDGKQNLGRYPSMSPLLWEAFGGNPLLDPRAYEAATTSTLATVVKNTVNIMTAANYSVRQRWFEPLVVIEEVDTIDDTTLARLYGLSTLSVVNEGAAYTELSQSDEEETAAFVKRGNYVGITLETLMRDKLQYIRRIPQTLSNSWYNTLSGMVAGVFTTNSAAGPALSDTGALFNSTAATSAGGHANLLTTALSHAGFSAARLAMRKQTDQPLGAGQKLLIEPKFLLVPADLETTAWGIRNSELVPEANNAGTTGNQTANQFYQKFEVVVVPEWTDATDWALAADPKMYPAIYLIFPRGQRVPSVFTADQDTNGSMFTNDELRLKVRMMTYRFSATYDVAPVADFRPLHKNNVA